ncbi:MAG TPA: porin [Candidatus Competibacteraceae bacterium]|nr:porin [Candidatus Competibacteraceae bacterium]
MKKALLPLAIALLCTAPAQADTTLFGRIGVATVYTDPDNGDANWDVRNDDSYVGVEGSESLAGDLKAIYHLEFSVDTGDTANLSGKETYVGLQGGFGKLRVGRLKDPYEEIIDSAGQMNITGTPWALKPGRLGNQLRYDIAPLAGDLVLSAATILDGASGEDSLDRWSLGALYQTPSIRAGITYLNNEFADSDQWGVDFAYNWGMFAVGASYEQGDVVLTNFATGNQALAEDVRAYGLAGVLRLGSNILVAHGGRREADDDGFNLTAYALGAEHRFSKRTKIYAEFEHTDFEDDSKSPDQNVLALGMRHDF